MKSNHTSILAVISCFLIAFGTAQAQTNDDLTNLREAIERNAELLQMAKELVSETNSIKARASLQTAAKLHAQSVQLLNLGATATNLRRAADMARKAREAIHQTIALAKKEARLEEEATKAIDRATNRLERVVNLMNDRHGQVPASVVRLTQESRNQLQRSRDNMREHLYEIALRLAVSSEQLSNRALTMLKREVTNLNAVLNEIEKTDRVLERLNDQVAADSKSAVRRMQEEARQLQQKSKESYRAGKPGAALELTEQSRMVAARALRLITSSASRENVEQAIQLTDALLSEASDIIVDRPSEQLRKRVTRAGELQRDAKNQYQRGNYENALRLTVKARETLKDALSEVRRALNETEVQATLVATDQVIARLRESLTESDNGTATDLYTRCLAQQEEAWSEFRMHNLRSALAHTKLARRLAQRAMRLLNDEEI